MRGGVLGSRVRGRGKRGVCGRLWTCALGCPLRVDRGRRAEDPGDGVVVERMIVSDGSCIVRRNLGYFLERLWH